MKIAAINIATGGYEGLFEQSKECISNNFFRSHDVDLFLFTDSDKEYHDDRIGIKKYKIKRAGWPGDTLFRYHYFLLAEKELLEYDYIYYIDVDMNVIAPVGEEINSDLVATLHPGFYKKAGATFENRSDSTAYVKPSPGDPYYAGGFQGGKPEAYLAAAKKIRDNINEDIKNGITAIWHDESHWNGFLHRNKPTLTLDPSYCYPEDVQPPWPWISEFVDNKKIIVIEKDEKGLRA